MQTKTMRALNNPGNEESIFTSRSRSNNTGLDKSTKTLVNLQMQSAETVRYRNGPSHSMLQAPLSSTQNNFDALYSGRKPLSPISSGENKLTRGQGATASAL